MILVNRYLFVSFFLFGIFFSQDTTPPYYTYFDDGSGNSIPSVYLDFDETVNFDDGSGNLSINMDAPMGCCMFQDDESGIYSIGVRFTSPSGQVEDIYIRGQDPLNFIWGSWSQYSVFSGAMIYDDSMDYAQFNLVLPATVEYGTYQIEIIVADVVGNELVLSGQELSSLNNSGDYSSITFEIESQIHIDEYGDVPILNWGWGSFHLVLIDSYALSALGDGSDIYILDELGIPDQGCDGNFAPVIVGNNTYQGIMDTPYELVCGQGIDLCELSGPRLPGYVEGNSMKIYVTDNNNTFEGEVTEYTIGEGIFGEPLTYITGINFQRSDFELSDINSFEDNSSRNQYRYNVYRNEELFLSEFQSVYYIDEDIDNNVDYCYEVYLIDNYDDSEFLATDEVCFYIETDFLSGDVNQDESLDVLDIVSIVGYILGSQEFDENEFHLSDYNQDGFVNVLDVVGLVQVILGE